MRSPPWRSPDRVIGGICAPWQLCAHRSDAYGSRAAAVGVLARRGPVSVLLWVPSRKREHALSPAPDRRCCSRVPRLVGSRSPLIVARPPVGVLPTCAC